MIKFFKKIWQQLLSEGKTGKYFKYAIGEISLVIFGFLMVLEIIRKSNTTETLEPTGDIKFGFFLREP